MSKTKVYIDGQAGTTGLQIFDRIGAREDLELMRIDEDKRHDNEERRKFLNGADIVFLCLPDAGAIEAVSLIDNPNVRVIDASTAHRTADGWTYGFPELSAEQRAAIASSHSVRHSATGAAILAGTAVGLYKDIPTACEKIIREKDPSMPIAENSAAYEPYYRIYTSVYPALAGVYGDLAKL